MSLVSRVFGWAPPDNAEYIELPLDIQPFHGLKSTRKSNQISSAATSAGTTSLLNVQSTSASSTSSSSTLEQSSCNGLADTGDTTSQHGTNPTWVARPRNKFILFRCDYIRKHSHDWKYGLGGETEKSLSKQAAEAWHHLSKEEHLYWRECATGERIEHARRYPNYRYRPRKSAMARRHQVRSLTNIPKPKSSQIISNPHPQSSSGSSVNRNPPKHMLSVIKPTYSRPSHDVPRSAVRDLSDQSFRPQTKFDTPELNFLTQTNPSTSTSSVGSSLSNWNGGNVVHPFGLDSSSDVSMSSRLSQISLSSHDLGLEMADATMNNNTDITNQAVIHECTAGEMEFAPPRSDCLHHQQQQQQLFNNGLYQPTENFWISYPAIDGGSGMQMAQIESQADSFNAACMHAQHTMCDSAYTATSTSSTPSIPNSLYETMTFAGVGGAPGYDHEQLFAMGF